MRFVSKSDGNLDTSCGWILIQADCEVFAWGWTGKRNVLFFPYPSIPLVAAGVEITFQ